MDAFRIAELLVEIEKHVVLGEGHITRQREIIAELERRGHPTVSANRLLCLFLETQELHIAHRDRLLKELALSEAGRS
jgi:hypothetical protein